MKNVHKLIIAGLLTAGLIGSAFAAEGDSQNCPSVQEVRTATLTTATKTGQGFHYGQFGSVSRINIYQVEGHTTGSDTYKIVVKNVHAYSKAGALAIAAKKVQTVTDSKNANSAYVSGQDHCQFHSANGRVRVIATKL